MSDILNLAGRVALVTGAGQNVGRGIALTFAAHGASVVVNDFYLERAEAVAQEIKNAGGEAIALQADVTNLESVKALAAKAAERYGGIDILINNAGNGGPSPSADVMKPYWETAPAVWNEVIGVNLYGPLHCTSAIIPLMIKNGGGRIVTIISEAARVGEVGLEIYSAAKAGAAGLTRALARGLGRHNILANNVAIAAMSASSVGRRMQSDEALTKSVLSKYVVRRLGEPSDVAGMVLFLASDASGWITGQTFPVNGGFSFNL